jgi:anti-sigma factor (TIGR02949 family)
MTGCADKLLLLQGLVDGELDAANSLAIEAHVKSCPDCAEELARIGAVRELLAAGGVRHQAPEGLRDRIEDMLAAETDGVRPVARVPSVAPSRFNARWASGGALAGIAASLALMLAMPQITTASTQDQLVASHVRSLLANHVTDIATSNRHVVKPWFNGKIDFAPPVVELADEGFPLVGGRLDYIDDHVVAAIVYHRQLHTINLFVRPAGTLALPIGITTHREGYNLIRWTRGGLEFWAVSDVETKELELFREMFVRRTSP